MAKDAKPQGNNDISVDTLVARARLLAKVRQFFAALDVVEVQTPLLGTHTVTDPDVEAIGVPGYGFLQTSPEYFLKRLLVAGMPDCYQLGPCFRHGELGRLHHPEFTMLEWYRLGFDHQQLMAEVAELVCLLLGPGKFKQLSYADVIAQRCPLSAPRDVLDLAFADGCAALTSGRYFITPYPADQAALARLQNQTTDAASPDMLLAARFELVIDGVEIANGYWELQDKQEHVRRFAEDNAERQQRQLPPRSVDQNFLSALDQGLPSCAGVAVGLDRLFMLVLEQDSLDKVIAFRHSR